MVWFPSNNAVYNNQPYGGLLDNSTLFTQAKTNLSNLLGPLPEYPSTPNYVAPAYDRSRVRFLQQQEAAPQLGALRGGVIQALQGARRATNPNVTGLQSRQALAGYGQGLANILGQAGQAARSQYEAERAPDIYGAQAEYEAEQRRANAQYQAMLNDRGLLAQSLLQELSRLSQPKSNTVYPRPALPRHEAYTPRQSTTQQAQPVYGYRYSADIPGAFGLASQAPTYNASLGTWVQPGQSAYDAALSQLL